MDMDGTLAVEASNPQGACQLCHRIISSENEAYAFRAMTICQNCKNFLDNLPPPRVTIFHRSQRLIQTNFRTTPSGSRRWRRDFPDMESSGSDDEEYSGWEEVAVDENAQESLVHRSSAFNERNIPVDWLTDMHSLQIEGTVRVGVSRNAQAHVPDLFANLEDHETSTYTDFFDYLPPEQFEAVIRSLVEAEEASRGGAPRAAFSFVNNLKRVVVTGKEDDIDGLICAVCKDPVSVGCVVNRLPCFHLYHPSCIMTWLNLRNTCPLCRYELPTDDNYEVENMNRNDSQGLQIQEVQQYELPTSDSYEVDDSQGLQIQEVQEGGVTDEDDTFSEEEDEGQGEMFCIGSRGRVRWLFVGAPVVGVVGIGLMLWLSRGRACARRW